VWLWASGLLLALALLARGSRRARDRSPQRIAYQGALGGLMLGGRWPCRSVRSSIT